VAGEYEQFCSVAKTLDVVGDRWTLLIVRELLSGQRRYRDLQQDLPGIATNLLAARLRRLEAEGLVAASATEDRRGKAYQLTPAGHRLRPVLESLAVFGMMSLMPERAAGGSAFRGHWLELPLRAMLVPGVLDDDLVVRFEFDAAQPGGAARTAPIQFRLSSADLVRDDGATPHVTLGGDPGALLASVREPGRLGSMLDEGRLRTKGRQRDLARLARALRPPAAARGHLSRRGTSLDNVK
jgi:DNA-binding HxlR family transcriptional regulator